MQRVSVLIELIRERAQKLLEDGIVNRVIGWKKGEFFYDRTPAVFQASDDLSELIYDGFCSANLSKYLIQENKKDGKILALLKPCDTYSFNQLIKEHQINRENVYILGIGCPDMLDINKISINLTDRCWCFHFWGLSLVYYNGMISYSNTSNVINWRG